MDENMTAHDWGQIKIAASGNVDGTSDDWPHLRRAIEKLTSRPFGHRRSAQWLQGFCQGVLLQPSHYGQPTTKGRRGE